MVCSLGHTCKKTVNITQQWLHICIDKKGKTIEKKFDRPVTPQSSTEILQEKIKFLPFGRTN